MLSNKHCRVSEHRLAHELPPQQQSDFFWRTLSSAGGVKEPPQNEILTHLVLICNMIAHGLALKSKEEGGGKKKISLS